jgi:GABA permease
MRHYLVVANQTLGGQPLADKVKDLMAAGPCRFHVVVPATHPRHHMTWTEGEATAIARGRLEAAITRLRGMGAEVDGEVGDARPVDAVGDAIRSGPRFDAIVLSTLPPGLSRWLGQDLPHRLERNFGLPVIHLVGEVAAVA